MIRRVSVRNYIHIFRAVDAALDPVPVFEKARIRLWSEHTFPSIDLFYEYLLIRDIYNKVIIFYLFQQFEFFIIERCKGGILLWLGSSCPDPYPVFRGLNQNPSVHNPATQLYIF